MSKETTARIRALNDELRVNNRGGTVLLTRGIVDQSLIFAVKCRAAVARHNNFAAENDPYDEHDFGSVEVGPQRIFWKIDYYDLEKVCGSPDPSNPAVTSRVLTIMLSQEY